MPVPAIWTDAQRAELRRLREIERWPWTRIGPAVGHSWGAARNEGVRIGVTHFRRSDAIDNPPGGQPGGLRRQRFLRQEAAARPVEHCRPAIPAGHPASWGVISGGQPYPMPVFL